MIETYIDTTLNSKDLNTPPVEKFSNPHLKHKSSNYNSSSPVLFVDFYLFAVQIDISIGTFCFNQISLAYCVEVSQHPGSTPVHQFYIWEKLPILAFVAINFLRVIGNFFILVDIVRTAEEVSLFAFSL